MTTNVRQSNTATTETGWAAHLRLAFVVRGARTVLGRCRRFGPLAIQRPFYPEDDVCHAYLLHPPGGVAGGDTLNLECSVGPAARAVVTTPGATKFYCSNGPLATQHLALDVAAGALLEWLPQENIFFERANVRSRTHIKLAADAALAYWEIHCLGRPVNDIPFDQGALDSTLTVEREGMPILIERLRVNADNRLDSTGLRGHAISATAVFGPTRAAMTECIRELTNAPGPGVSGVTRLEDFLVVRHLGPSSEHARQLFQTIWNTLRPDVSALAPCQPRIWRT